MEASSGKKGQSRLSLEREVIRRETVGYMSFSHHLNGRDGVTKFCVYDVPFVILKAVFAQDNDAIRLRGYIGVEV